MNIEAIVRDYVDSGDALETVATRHGIGKHRLRTAVNHAGVSRSRGPAIADDVRHAAIADRLAGMSLNAAAKKHGVNRNSLRNWVAEWEGENPNELTGGQWVRRGLTWHWESSFCAIPVISTTTKENSHAA